MERETTPTNPLDQLCAELSVSPMAEFRGGAKLPVDQLSEHPATMFLVEDDKRNRFNLKVANFNDQEVVQTNRLALLLSHSNRVRIPKVISHEPDRYIQFEHIRGLPVSRDSFWRQAQLIGTVLEAFDEVDQALNREPLIESDAAYIKGQSWIENKLTHAWVEPILNDAELTRGGLITPEFIGQIQSYETAHASEMNDLVSVWRDSNGDHLIVPPSDTLDTRLGVVDIDVVARPRHYMPMRFLAWSLLRMDDDRDDLEGWVNRTRQQFGLDGAEYDPTFVLSLTGVLYDLTNGERDNKRKREIAIAVKNIINNIISRDEADQKSQ